MSAGQAELLPVDDALALLLAQADAEPIHAHEIVAASEAEGRVLGETLAAGLDLPPWPNSAMDGYALRHADLVGGPLPVSQKIFAGMQPDSLKPGTCARIFTGAPLPYGADTVEMQENVAVLEDGRVRFSEPLRHGQNVRPQGGEVRRGDPVLAAGTRLGPIELGLVASLGLTELKVVRRVRVALLSTGDELVEAGQTLAPGQIYNSNRVLLRHWLERLGCTVIDLGVLPDDLQKIRDCLDSLADVDLILSSGGVSVGEADFLGQVLREEGEPTLWKLAIKPGKPLTCGRYRGIPLLGLPGNPASTLVTFGILGRPYLLRRMGVVEVEPLSFAVAAGFAWPKPGKRREYLRARIEQGKAQLYANQSSSVLRSAAWAQGLVVVPEHARFEEGEPVRFIPFSELIG